MFTHLDVQTHNIDTTNYKGQRWYKVPNGPYPSITTILGQKEKPWLKDWTKMLGADKAKKETQRCAERGDAVHLMCEKFLNNEDNPTAGNKVSDIKMFNQMRMALKKHVNNIRAQEVALWSDELGIAGRVDLVAEYDGVLSIVDFKTSNSIKTEEMILDYFLQCTFYAIAYNEIHKEPIEDIVIVMGVEKGMMPLVFKKKIDNYVAPLLKRINTFYKSLEA